MRVGPVLALASALALAILPGCSGCEPARRHLPATSQVGSASAAPAPPPPPPPARVLLDFVRDLPRCDLDHHGPLLDLGTEAMVGRFGWAEGVPSGMTPVEHDGATWARILDRKLTVSFVLTERTPIFVAARAVGYAARQASVALDDQPLGTLSFARRQVRVATSPTTTLPVDPGAHVLTLHFYGHARESDAYADLDWLRVGIPEEADSVFGAPTLRDVIAPAAALGGVPHQALALRAPGTVRCAVRLPEQAHLRASVGLQGTGEGEAEVRVLVDGQKPVVVRTIHLEGSENSAWTEIDVPLSGFTKELASLELRATQAPKGGRVLFGDATVSLPAIPPPPAAPARAVILVVLDAVERPELPPWRTGTTPPLPAFTDLSEGATTFLHHRAPTTVVPAVMASLLTGLPPIAHALTDENARLSATRTTIAAVARDANVNTAMFTGVPYTFRAFGFDGAWEKFVEVMPSSGDPATAPIDDAAAWVGEVAKLKEGARMLAVVHSRGSHPPWDVTPKELGTAAPPDYTGLIEPRPAAQRIAKLRKKHARGALNEADRERIRSLETLALAGQDRALGALVASLKASNLWDATLLVVTGDVASGASEGALFADGLDLKEPLLELPLYVHFPGGLYAGKEVADPTEVMDLARTAVAALGLGFSNQPSGRELGAVAAGLSPMEGPQIATLDAHYSVRWGDLILSGRYPAAPSLCDVTRDPTCAFNRREVMPLASEAMFRRLVAFDLAMRAPVQRREPATIDPDAAAALSVWGATD